MSENLKDESLRIIESLSRMTKFILIKFDIVLPDTKEFIIRNFIAKSFSLLNSIKVLLENRQQSEALALYRLLIERYLYLEYLSETHSFQEFNDWSYIKSYELRNGMRSNKDFCTKEKKSYLEDTKEQTLKYQELKRTNKWSSPDLKKFAKKNGLLDLYSFGYDFGSSYIHPRAEEGLLEALRLVKNEHRGSKRANNILTNSIRISYAIVEFGVNESHYDWGKFLKLYLLKIMDYLNNDEELPDLRSLENLVMASLLEEKTTSSHLSNK